MGRIRMARLILGGIVAGVVINISEFALNQVVLAADMTTALARMNLPPIAGSAIPVFVSLGMLGGIATVWLYAAIRPRFGPGPRTAVIAGLATWFFAYFYRSMAMLAMGMYPLRMIVISTGWALIECVVAALLGASLYTEA